MPLGEPATVTSGVWMIEFRRGIASERKTEHWHSHPDCRSYPSRSFAIRSERPPNDYLCRECQALAQGASTC